MDAYLDRSDRTAQNRGDLLVPEISINGEHESFAHQRFWPALPVTHEKMVCHCCAVFVFTLRIEDVGQTHQRFTVARTDV